MSITGLHMKVDPVAILNNARFMSIGDAALGLWTRLSAWSFLEGTNGIVPRWIPQAVSKERGHDKLVRQLIEVGLLVERGSDLEIYNFAKKFGSSAELQKRLESGRMRVAKHRLKSQQKDGCNALQHIPCNALHAVTPSLLFSSILRSDQGEGVQGETPAPANDGKPSGMHEVPAAAVPARQRYREAYERGVAEGKGTSYAFPNDQWSEGALHQALLAHAFHRGERVKGPELLEWISDHAHDFARWLAGQALTEPKYLAWYSSFGPKGFFKWLNERSKAREAKEVG